MKTQIILLEPHDDTLSVRDKLNWSQAPRVLLIWPEKGKVLRSKLDLILLERYSSSHGSQLAVLTIDKKVIYQAEEAGIPVFQTRSEAQIQPWGKSYREFQRQDLEKYAAENLPAEPLERKTPQPRKKLPLWTRITIFTLGLLSVVALAGFLLPSAELVFQSNTRQHDLTITIQAQPDRDQITLSGLVPARELMIIVEEQLSRPSSGTAPVPGEYARGEVVFTNLGEEEVTIPPDTILSTSEEPPILFRTLIGGNIPSEQGGQIVLAIEAFLPGESGNLPANQITKINLEAGAELIVTNPLPTAGGTDILVPAPTLSDKLNISRKMTRLLEEEADSEIQSKLASGDFLLSEELSILELIEEEYSPEVGTPGEILWLDKTIQYQVEYISGDDLQDLAFNLIKTQYRDNTYLLDPNSILVQPFSSLEKDGDDYIWEFQVSWIDNQVLNKGEISEMISGKSMAQAEKILLEEMDLDVSPQIRIQPGWWPIIPALPFRIQIIQGGV